MLFVFAMACLLRSRHSCVIHLEKLDIPESITKKDMVLVLRHWQPIFRASVLAPPVEVIVPKKYSTLELLNEHLKPAARKVYGSISSRAVTASAEHAAMTAKGSAGDAGAEAGAGVGTGSGAAAVSAPTDAAETGSAGAVATEADADADAAVDVEDDADYEVAKWSEFFGNLNGSARTKTIRKLKFAGVITSYVELMLARRQAGRVSE